VTVREDTGMVTQMFSSRKGILARTCGTTLAAVKFMQFLSGSTPTSDWFGCTSASGLLNYDERGECG